MNMKKNLPARRRKNSAAAATEICLAALTWAAALLSAGVLLYLIGFILSRGLPYLKPSLFSLRYNSTNVSLLPALISTVYMTLLSLALALPLGIGAAIYLAEYARRGHRGVLLIRLAAETLAGIPSIVYGLFGMLFFVTWLGWGYSLLAGACTLAVMILPLLLRASEEALLAVPDAYREGALALGAGKLRTVWRIVLPAAVPGVLAGVILAVGRVVGETAALIYTAGTVARIPVDVFSSARTLSVHMYALSREGLHTNEAYATAVVLLAAVTGLNALAASVAGRLRRES
ncbi:MAG: phosphate ABC transporter permease PstA [Gracilibacteraceae bacterium]|jgi:phosphate transport system permease protein|nr:phosphate ABC transporter permease PstA [Gracilibacteraceae bacterium]